jgi:hypothetical protein
MQMEQLDETKSIRAALCDDFSQRLKDNVLRVVTENVDMLKLKFKKERHNGTFRISARFCSLNSTYFIADRTKIEQCEAQSAELQAQLAAYKKENYMLRRQLITILQSHNSQGDVTDPPPSTVSYADYQRLVQKVDVLQKQLLDSNDDRRTEAEARRFLIIKLKNAKSVAKEWMNYHLNHQTVDAISSAGTIPRHPELLSPMPHGLEDIILTRESVSKVDQNFLLTQTGKVLRQKAVLRTENNVSGMFIHQQSSVSAEKSNLLPSSQQETMPMDHDRNNGKEILAAPADPVCEDEDVPIIVSERPVKRRRVRKSRPGDEETPGFDLSKVKQEPTNSDMPFHRTDTFDLDEVDHTVDIPQRAMRMIPPRLLHNFPSSIRHEQPQSEPLSVDQIQTSELLSILKTTELGNRFDSIPQHPNISDNRSQSQPPDTAGDSDQTTLKRAVLTPVDVNMRLLPSKQPTSKSKPRKYGDAKQRRSAPIHIMTEDGEFDHDNDGHATHKTAEAKSRAEKAAAQLESLLEQGENPTPTRITRTALKQPKTLFKVPAAPKRTQRIEKPIGQSPSSTKDRPRIALRNAPLESLSLADFKLNPAMNEGLNFAFSDAVYGKERRCLPGCIDTRCCGPAMRALASALKPTVPRPANPSSAEDESLTDEQYTIKWHLGAKFNRQEVARMSAHDRAELLLDAQAKYVAEQYGRHRNVSDRRRTPPGFWDSDMPSTQEQENQRQQAQKVERVLVAERHREAMKGGRWLFRDE